ncbi:MAG: hypothetical protein JST09_04525 [Bacteroidetes bacterium]|nr:hypothetical protein [Bacteroidota bacterium]MBS1610895.1 hypothetical protein [Bacteroidota bacterium]
MKKTFFRYLMGSIPLIALFGSAYAQKADLGMLTKEVPLKIYVFDEMKAEGAVLINNIADINARALKQFNKTFKSIANAKWYETQEGGFVAKFQENGVDTRANYDHKGNWKGTIRTYTEENLPKDIRHLVKSTYYDYTIFLVQEVSVGDKTAFLVKIEDANTLKTIRVIDGEMDEYESYRKG